MIDEKKKSESFTNLIFRSSVRSRRTAFFSLLSCCLLFSEFVWEKQTTLMMTDANELYDMTISFALLFSLLHFFFSILLTVRTDGLIKLFGYQ